MINDSLGLVTGYLLSQIGRKNTMLLMSIPFASGWVLLTLTAPLNLAHAAYFYVGRILAG